MKKDADVLRSFLEKIPERPRVAMEFRNATWFDDEIFDALRARNVALCIGDVEDRSRATPVVATADFGYVRLRRERYEPEDLERWAATILAQPWRDAFAFFDHEADGPLLAGALNEKIRAAATATAGGRDQRIRHPGPAHGLARARPRR
jgi:uncharacterized protein YecE (DUF72 family)